jgi:predicted nucleic acid-binding protein
MADSVYLETSMISALFDERPEPVCRAQHQQARQWYEEEGHNYELFTSAMAIEELRSGQYDHQMEAVCFAEGLELLPVSDEVLGVSQIYVDQAAIPRLKLGDAVHLAVAAVHRMDYLLTWNCRHLVNPNKVRRIAEINRRLGLMTPVIATPAMLYREDQP